MPLPTPETPVRPSELQPPCAGCPDPDNARRVPTPCTGPDRIEDPAGRVEFDTTSREQAVKLGGPACADIVVCPRTRGYRF